MACHHKISVAARAGCADSMAAIAIAQSLTACTLSPLFRLRPIH